MDDDIIFGDEHVLEDVISYMKWDNQVASHVMTIYYFVGVIHFRPLLCWCLG
jgi:hypothetical protein